MVQPHRFSSSYSEQLALAIEQNLPLVSPLTASLAVNSGCNSKCEYCWIWKLPVKNTPVDDLMLAVDSLADLGVYLISLTGGEPFLHGELTQVIQHMSRRGVISSSMTNGMILKPGRLVPYLEAGLNSLVLSLDTVDPVTYHFIRGVPLTPVLKGLDYAIQQRSEFPKFAVSVSCVVSKMNLEQIVPLIHYCSERNVSIGFQPLHPTFASGHEVDGFSFAEEDFPQLEEFIAELIQLRLDGYLINSSINYLKGFPEFLVNRQLPAGFRCDAGFSTITIDEQLNIKSCWSMKAIGNLHKDSLQAVWHSDQFRERRAAMLETECPGCWYRCHTEERTIQWLEGYFN